MLEKVDLNKSVDKENYKKLREEMDVKLGELQRACKAEKIPVVIVFDGFGAVRLRQDHHPENDQPPDPAAGSARL